MALEFIIKLKDLLNPNLGTSLKRADGALTQFQERANRGAGRMGASMDTLRTKVDQLRSVANSTTDWKIFKDASREANKLERQIDKLNGKATGKGGGFGLSGMLGGVGVGMGLLASAKMAGQMEQTNMSFGVMLGDDKKGQAMSKKLFDFAATTPYQTPEVYKSAQTQLAFGIKDTAIMKNMQMLGDVAMGDAEKLGSLTLAFSQTNAAGKLMGQDLLQYVNAGFNPLQEISAVTGIKMSLLRKQMEKGAISSEMVSMAFQHATQKGGRFYQMMEKQSHTALGMFSTLMDNAKMKMIAFGKWLEPVTKWLIGFASSLIENKAALIMLATGIGIVTLATVGWSAAQGILNVVMAMNPVIAIISGILILGGLIYGLVKQYDGWGKSMTAIWNITKWSTKQMLISWKDFGQGIWYWVEYGWLKFKAFTQWVAGATVNLAKALGYIATLQFSKAKEALTAKILVAADTDLENLKKSRNLQKAGNMNEIESLKKAIDGEKGKIGLTKVKAAKGINPTNAAADITKADMLSGLKRGGADMDSLKGGADGAMGSAGQKVITINIHRGLVEKLELHTVNLDKGMDQIEQVVKETFLRIVNSATGLAVN